MESVQAPAAKARSLHGLGVACGITAGIWLGAAEAPTKLVNAGFSPFAISLCMVAGVFTARWTFPTLLKGTSYVFEDLMEKKYLMVWAIMAGAIWAAANTLTVFAIRDVGLTVAFPLWNTNSLVGLLWGRLLFNEMKDAGARTILKIVLGAVTIVVAATLLGFSTIHGHTTEGRHAIQGVLAAGGASLLWGTMYVPYRKAYVSGMNPLSFVTIFTFGELATVFALVLAFDGGLHAPVFHSSQTRPMIFWLFLGGFVWVVGDLFQQFATKYVGIGRGIPLSNTNQLWGMAWGVLVFGELANVDARHKFLLIAGSVAMILGALAISSAVANERERTSIHASLARECDRYGLSYHRTLAAYAGSEFGDRSQRRAWWDWCIIAAAIGVFVWLGKNAAVPAIHFNLRWVVVLSLVLLAAAIACGWALRKITSFS